MHRVRRRRELGLLTWAFTRLATRVLRIPQMHLFTTLGRRLFWPWVGWSGVLLWLGRLRGQDAESVILRVGHLRGCEYELQQHRRIARRAAWTLTCRRRFSRSRRLTGSRDGSACC